MGRKCMKCVEVLNYAKGKKRRVSGRLCWLGNASLQRYWDSTPATWTCHLSQKKGLPRCDSVKDLGMGRVTWMTRESLSTVLSVLRRGGRGRFDIHKGEGDRKTERRERVKAADLQDRSDVATAKEHQEPPEAGTGSRRPPERKWPGSPLISTWWYGFRTSGLRNWDRINFCCFKPLSLCSLVTAATGSEWWREKLKKIKPLYMAVWLRIALNRGWSAPAFPWLTVLKEQRNKQKTDNDHLKRRC